MAARLLAQGLEGPAVAVYLTLWNRSDELDLVDLWRAAPITWG